MDRVAKMVADGRTVKLRAELDTNDYVREFDLSVSGDDRETIILTSHSLAEVPPPRRAATEETHE